MKIRIVSIAAIFLMIVLIARAQNNGTQTAQALANTSGCFECHSEERKAVCPTFHDIAARYKDKPEAKERMIEIVKKGGKGNWFEITHGVPMPPYSGRLSDEEIRNLVTWLLSQ